MLNLMNKSLPNAIKVNGRDFLINTDYRIWMRFTSEFKRWQQENMKGRLDIKYLFSLSIPVFENTSDYTGILEFAFPKCVVPHSNSSDNQDVLFYEYDGDYIYAAFMQAYGIDLLETDMHWHKFIALMNGMPDCTKLVSIMGYRAYTGEKIKDEGQIRRRLKEAWLPPYEETEEEKKADEEFNAYFG